MVDPNASNAGSRPGVTSRRDFLAATGAAALALGVARGARGAERGAYRAAVIGHTGRGNYGHGLDRVWLDVPATRLVAVADAQARGRAGAVKRLGRVKGFADYRRMLDEVKPDLVAVAPRWTDQHRDMVVAAAERGAKGIHATYRLSGGAVGYFDSVRGAAARPSRFGLRIFGTKGVLELHSTGYLPDVRFLADPSWSPGRTGKKWVEVSSAGVGRPEPIRDGGLHAGNVAAVKDLIAAIEKDRPPVAGIDTARTATEMIVAVFESHRVAGPVTFPLENRKNPLAML